MFQNIPLSEIDVTPNQPRVQIVYGERRYRASKLAGLTDIPAIVREVDDKTMFRLSLVENVQRLR
jgi:ParB family chromosome partitioning protein